MTRILYVQRHPLGPRVWVAGQRIHHGATGAVLLAVGFRRRFMLVAALTLLAHDRRDWRSWFRRERPPAVYRDRVLSSLSVVIESDTRASDHSSTSSSVTNLTQLGIDTTAKVV